MSVPEKGFTGREVGAFLTFVVAGVALGFGAYHAGQGLAGTGSGAAVSAAPANAGSDGQALYVGNCAGCHGAAAEGGVGPSLVPSAAWTGTEFAQAVLHGAAPGGRVLKSVMPRFAQSGLDGAPATDAQVQAIHAFVQTLP